MCKRYTVREEPFGLTLYDRESLRHQFIGRDHIEITFSSLGITHNDFEYLAMREAITRSDIPYSPIRIYYELTLACNLRCKLCYNNSAFARPNELATEEVIESLHNMRDANVIDVRFTGGEFTQRPDWFTIFQKAKELGFSVSCNTNGVYTNPNIVDQLASLDLEQITISIDGIGSNHDKHRGRNTFKKSLNSLKQLHKRGAKLRINTLVTKFSINDIEEMIVLASEFTSEINLFSPRFTGRALLHIDKTLTFEEHYQMSIRARALQAKYPHLNIIHFEGSTVYNSTNHSKYEDLGLMAGGPDGFTRFNIISDGSLYAGGYIPYIDPNHCLGNVRNDRIFDVWQNHPTLDYIRERSQHLKKLCSQCPELMKRCAGPIYEMELYREKNPGAINPFCVFSTGPPLFNMYSLPVESLSVQRKD